MSTPDLHAEETLSEKWRALSWEERVRLFREAPRAQAQELFLNLSTWDQSELLEALSESERRLWLRLLPPDDAADVVQHASEELREEYLALVDDASRREIIALLAYEEDVAGGLMNPRFIRLRPDMTADEAIAYVRRQAAQVASLHYAYVLDVDQRLLGVLGFRELFAAPPTRRVREFMRTEFVLVEEDEDQEDVARIFEERHLLAIPVVDAEGRMKGVVTLDDIVDVVSEEASEDIQKFGGGAALDGPYLEVGLFDMLRGRTGWLALLFLGEMLTATAMARFEYEISQAVVLALFVPLIISSGGNSGSQAATLVIRAMALGEVTVRDWWRVLRRELAAGAVMGIVLGLLGLARIVLGQWATGYYGEHYLLVACTIAVSLMGVVMFGTISGSVLPLILERLGLDPASASAPFVATLVDVTGVVIYFSVAAAILSGTLL